MRKYTTQGRTNMKTEFRLQCTSNNKQYLTLVTYTIIIILIIIYSNRKLFMCTYRIMFEIRT